MNWDAIAAVGQAVSALALFGVLIQVRHAREEVRRSVSHARLDAVRGLTINRMNSERLISIALKAFSGFGSKPSLFQKALMERAGLTLEESMTMQLDQWAHWQCNEEAIPYVNQMPNVERNAFERELRGLYHRDPFGALWYESQKRSLDPNAVRYLDNLLAQPE